MSNEKNNLRLAYRLLIVVDITLFFITFFYSSSWWQSLISLGLLLLVSVSLYYLNDRCFYTGYDSKLLPLIFFLLVFAYPNSLELSVYHFLSLLLVWVLYFNVKYLIEEDDKLSSLFFTSFLLSVGCIFSPMLIWLQLSLFIIDSFSLKIDFRKYLLISFSGIITPFIYLIAIWFILGNDFSVLLKSYSSFLFDINISVGGYSIVSLFYNILLAIVVLSSITYVFSGAMYLRSVSNVAIKRNMIFFLILVVSYIIYSGILDSRALMVLCIPLTFFIFYLFSNKIAKAGTKALCILLALATILLRIYYIIN